MSKYPNECCRCGFCCLAEPCPAELASGHPRGNGCCRFLRFNGEQAECLLVNVMGRDEMGIGAGCCIRARVISERGVEQFAAKSPDYKRRMAQKLKKRFANYEAIDV